MTIAQNQFLHLINELIRARKVGAIETIKLIRQHTGFPLKEAKDLYDQLASALTAHNHPPGHGWLVTWSEDCCSASYSIFYHDSEYSEALDVAKIKAAESHVDTVRVSRVMLVARVETRRIVELV